MKLDVVVAEWDVSFISPADVTMIDWSIDNTTEKEPNTSGVVEREDANNEWN